MSGLRRWLILIHDGRRDVMWFAAFGNIHARHDNQTPIVMGYAMNECESRYGETYSQMMAMFPERKWGTLANWKSVCAAIPWQILPDGVRFSQMRAVRTMTTAAAMKAMLERAVRDNLGEEDILEIRREELGENTEENDDFNRGLKLPKTPIETEVNTLFETFDRIVAMDKRFLEAAKIAKDAFRAALGIGL